MEKKKQAEATQQIVDDDELDESELRVMFEDEVAERHRKAIEKHDAVTQPA